MRHAISFIILTFFIANPAFASKSKVMKRIAKGKMSLGGKAAMKSLGETAKELKLVNSGHVFEEDDFVVLAKTADGSTQNKHVIAMESSEVDLRYPTIGGVKMYKYDMPSTETPPESFVLQEMQELPDRPHEFSKVVSVKQTFKNPATGLTHLQVDDVAVKSIDGKSYRTILNTWTTNKKGTTHANLYESVVPGGGHSIELRRFSETDAVSGALRLPDDIKGQVLTINLNQNIDRLTFVTTDGFQYTYKVGITPASGRRIYDMFTFDRIAKEPIVGGLESHMVKAASFAARVEAGTVQAARGVKIKPTTAR